MSIRPRCSGQTRSILTAHVQLVNSKVLRMDVVDLGRNVDRMLLPVTAAIYQNGVENALDICAALHLQCAGHLKWRLAPLATKSCMDSFKD